MAYKTKEWRNAMRVTVDYNYMMSRSLGDKGITDSELRAIKDKAEQAFDYVNDKRGRDDLYMGWTELPYNQDAIVSDILATAKEIRKKFKYFVVLGIGGSALGPSMVFNALKHLHHNELPPKLRGGPKFYVEDNVDPVRMQALLDVIEPEKTCFNVISKSGATSETMAQFLIIADILEKKGVNLADNMIFTTDACRGNLIKIDDKFGGKFKKYVLPDGVGGRFSELCPVGLLPAAVLGIDIKGMLAGAAYMDSICSKPNIAKNPALACAALMYITMQQGKNIHVLMPYSDNLKLMADWYCQLWAESIGKAVDYAGNTVNAGTTPVKSLGVTDQHSQVQLYIEGPYDKVITFISVKNYGTQMPIAYGYDDIPDVGFLGGHTMQELIQAENKATAYALMRAGRMNYTINMPEVNAFTLGQLMFMLELQTAYAGAMLGIDTFNQPGVENGKKATFALLGKKGYENKKREIDSAPPLDEKYIV
ncbi:MAG: glucose-6-phosphate isomerase [Clostridiales bacterium]|nr:glucose-6-phosphate isomerase [Clostridiales bacterium]